MSRRFLPRRAAATAACLLLAALSLLILPAMHAKPPADRIAPHGPPPVPEEELASAIPQGKADGEGRGLTRYRDKNRVLLVFTPDTRAAAYTRQTALWDGEKAGFAERQLVVVPVPADAQSVEGTTPALLARRYGVKAGEFAVVLLGKDGHDAFHADKPVRAQTLYEIIDAMPMRRDEMRQQARERGE